MRAFDARARLRIGIYVVRLAAAAAQLAVVFALAEVSDVVLGIYSFATAALAVLIQGVHFEGSYLAIAKVLPSDQLRKIHKTTNVIWLLSLTMLSGWLLQWPAALAFMLVFVLNVGSEWAINFVTIDDRIASNDHRFHRLLFLKILLVDAVLPGLLVLLMVFGPDSYLLLTCALLFTLTFAVQIYCVGLPRSFRELRLPKFNFVYGVVVKRLDGMFIRLFANMAFGPAVLGAIQPLLSVSRTLNVLTPTWISVNFSKLTRRSQGGQLKLSGVLSGLVVSYLLYAAASVGIYYAFEIIEKYEYQFATVLLAVLFFGNQNTKALLRSLSIIQDQYLLGNVVLSLSLGLKIAFAMALLPCGMMGVLLSSTAADILTISIMLFQYYRKAG